MNGVLPVVRLQLMSWRLGVGLPVGILALVFALNLGLFGSMGDVVPPDGRFTGGLASVYIVFGVGLLQTMTQTLPFALGMGVTRRAFYAGVALLGALEALGLGALLVVLGAVERAGGGWGIGLRFFAPRFLTVADPVLQYLVLTVPLVAFGAAGMAVGVVSARWGRAGAYALSLSTGVALAVPVALATWRGWWPAVGDWFAGQSAAALFAGYPLVLAVLLGGAGWLALRRAAV